MLKTCTLVENMTMQRKVLDGNNKKAIVFSYFLTLSCCFFFSSFLLWLSFPLVHHYVHTFAYYISFGLLFFRSPLISTFAKLPLAHYKFKYNHILYRYALGYNSICFRTVIFIHRTLLGAACIWLWCLYCISSICLLVVFFPSYSLLFYTRIL